MSTHPCPTCGHVHDAPPAVDWTGYEEAVTELASAWLAEQDHLLDCWREGVVSADRGPTSRRRKAEDKVRAYLGSGCLVVLPRDGRIVWYRGGAQKDVTIYAVTDGPIRPGGAA